MLLPPLETGRLVIRPFAIRDLEAVLHLLDVQLGHVEIGSSGAQSLADRERWLQWTVLSYDALAKLNQPPYGDRAIVLNRTGRIIGAYGYTPCLGPFGQLPSDGGRGAHSRSGPAGSMGSDQATGERLNPSFADRIATSSVRLPQLGEAIQRFIQSLTEFG